MSCKNCGVDWYGINPTKREPLWMEPDYCKECKMSMERCSICEKMVDTDFNVEGTYYKDGEFVCQDCTDLHGLKSDD